jgi:hypothetical protein
MTPHSGNKPPSPELLAAYFDGECEGRDDLALLKQQIEDWLATHPEAQADLSSYRRLLQVWQETAPPEPDSMQWAALLARLEDLPAPRPVQASGKKILRRLAWLGVAASLACLWIFWPREPAPAPVLPGPVVTQPMAEEEILEVATASEVAIIRVEGADTHTLVVGELPLQGNLELLTAGEVVLTSIQPDAEDNMLPELRTGPGSAPLIWARVDSEQEDP